MTRAQITTPPSPAVQGASTQPSKNRGDRKPTSGNLNPAGHRRGPGPADQLRRQS